MVALQQAGFRAALIPLLPDEFEFTEEAASLRDNDRATGFYEGLGFERDGAAQTRPALGAPEVRYARSLPYYTF